MNFFKNSRNCFSQFIWGPYRVFKVKNGGKMSCDTVPLKKADFFFYAILLVHWIIFWTFNFIYIYIHLFCLCLYVLYNCHLIFLFFLLTHPQQNRWRLLVRKYYKKHSQHIILHNSRPSFSSP